MPPMKTKPSEDTALVVAEKLTSAELDALLQQTGWQTPPTSGYARIKLNGSALELSDTGESFIYNPKKPDVPAMTVRIIKPPDEYFGIWVSDKIANDFGHPEIAGNFAKKWTHADDNRWVTVADEYYDALNKSGIVDEFGKVVKGGWRADMQVQIVPENGTLTGEETTYTLSLSATSVAEFKGSYKSPSAGSVSEFNFIRKLSMFAMENAIASGEDPERAVLNALTSLTLGGVVAEVRVVRAQNDTGSMTWSVIVFDPIHIEPVDAGPALEAGDVEEAAF